MRTYANLLELADDVALNLERLTSASYETTHELNRPSAALRQTAARKVLTGFTRSTLRELAAKLEGIGL